MAQSSYPHNCFHMESIEVDGVQCFPKWDWETCVLYALWQGHTLIQDTILLKITHLINRVLHLIAISRYTFYSNKGSSRVVLKS